MKQVILVNESLKLPRGKLAAQVAHASVASLLSAKRESQQTWVGNGMPKVVLAVDTELELLRFYDRAREADLPAQVIRDAGKTVVEAGTITCLGIGPAGDAEINAITSELPLVR
jgi:PTH2 family peptidyl-tRNA hydrolase